MFYPLPLISLPTFKYFFGPNRINISIKDILTKSRILSRQHVHASRHTHTSSPQPVDVCLALKQSQISPQKSGECADVRQQIHCRLHWHVCGCVCARALVFVPFCVYVRACKCVLACGVCVCVRICKLLFMLIFERVFRPVVMECFWKSLYCFCTGSWKSVCPRPEFCRRGLHFLTQTEMCLAARRAQTLRIRGLLLLLLHPHFTLSPSSYYLSNSLFLSVCLSRSGADKAHIQRVFAVGWWSLY